MNETNKNKIRVGFFSFTEITDPGEHHSYNEWHQLDHMPEQYPLDGIAYGQRWVSTPACRAARTVSEPPLDSIHYMTLYLMTEPVERTLREFMQLGRDLHAVGRFHLHRRARLSGPFGFRSAAASERVLISPEAIPYRPNLGVYVEVEELAQAESGGSEGEPIDDDLIDAHLGALCAEPGVAGAWWFADGQQRVTVTWLDAPPLKMVGRLEPIVARRRAESSGRALFAGPLEAITPWQWSWFDPE
ncbi:MAG: hypothetical protein QOE62_498 [Actinomycetota bacterium]|jgi:hypothetical protein|nr:hypothetical protein [Actinomycetota bacterium]